MNDVQRVRRELNLLLDVVIDEIRTSDEHEAEIRYESAGAFAALDRLEEALREILLVLPKGSHGEATDSYDGTANPVIFRIVTDALADD